MRTAELPGHNIVTIDSGRQRARLGPAHRVYRLRRAVTAADATAETTSIVTELLRHAPEKTARRTGLVS